MATKKGRQRAIKYKGQPPERWAEFMRRAQASLVKRGGFDRNADDGVKQLADEIVRMGEGENFLAAARRGRPTVVQNLRYRLLREVENAIGAAKPRRREDRNTPEAKAAPAVLVLECGNCSAGGVKL